MNLTACSRAAWALVAVALLGLLSFASLDTDNTVDPGERAEALNDLFACPTCDGQSVAESNAGVAATIRQFIRDEIAAGATDTDIRNALVNSYGTEVLLNPPSDGVATLVWMLPVLVLTAGVAVVTVTVRRSSGSADPTAADERLVAELLDQQRAEVDE